MVWARHEDGHVMRMEEDHVVRRVMTKVIPGKRKRGRQKTRQGSTLTFSVRGIAPLIFKI